jgi:hypothetical protein
VPVRRRRSSGIAPRDVPAPVAGEVYLEYFPIGKLLRAVAIDAATGVEVTVFGPSSVSREDLGRIAARKLARRLARETAARSGQHV